MPSSSEEHVLRVIKTSLKTLGYTVGISVKNPVSEFCIVFVHQFKYLAVYINNINIVINVDYRRPHANIYLHKDALFVIYDAL